MLAISGSLRKASLNTMVLQAAAHLAPHPVSIQHYRELHCLPLFNPDLSDELRLPPEVRSLEAAVAEVDALLIASPEYAHGVSGIMKNALDWLVGGEAFVGKSVALINTSPRATIAYQALTETVKTMGGVCVPQDALSIPLVENAFDLNTLLADADKSDSIKVAIQGVVDFIIQRRVNEAAN